MNTGDILCLLPFLVLVATSVLVMLMIAYRRNHSISAGLTSLGLAGAFVSLPIPALLGPREITGLIVIDPFTVFFSALILVATAVTVLISRAYLDALTEHKDEYYVLLLFAALGAVVLTGSSHFASFFLGLEILGVSLYALIAYRRREARAVEAGLKYLILAAASDAFLLFGIALIYTASGTLRFSELAAALGASPNPVLWPGLGLFLVGIGFKLSLVPFHMWTPDVYQGAPAPVTGFLSTVSKAAVFIFLLRVFAAMDLRDSFSAEMLLTSIAIATMVVGNLLALLQDNVKRILAYSSIAHFGYLVIPLVAPGPSAPAAVCFYLVAYFLTTLGAFGIVTITASNGREMEDLEDYRGLGSTNPWLAAAMTALLLSLAGIPLTAGFLGKFYLVIAGLESYLLLLVGSLIVTSVIGLFYYIRVIVIMYSPVDEAQPLPPPVRIHSGTAGLVVAVLTLLVIYFGIYPEPLLDFIALVTPAAI